MQFVTALWQNCTKGNHPLSKTIQKIPVCNPTKLHARLAEMQHVAIAEVGPVNEMRRRQLNKQLLKDLIKTSSWSNAQ